MGKQTLKMRDDWDDEDDFDREHLKKGRRAQRIAKESGRESVFTVEPRPDRSRLVSKV